MYSEETEFLLSAVRHDSLHVVNHQTSKTGSTCPVAGTIKKSVKSYLNPIFTSLINRERPSLLQGNTDLLKCTF